MKFLVKTRLRIGNSILSKKTRRRKRKIYYTGFSNVKTIGVVWDASKINEFSTLSKFHQEMQAENIDIKIIGYYPGKELPAKFTAFRYLSCIRENEVSFFYLPLSTESEFFIKNKFDILIDINFEKVLQLRTITSLSSANLKVGLNNGESSDSIFDLMIELKTPVQTDVYLNEAIRYLKMINPGLPPQNDKTRI